MTSRAHLPNDVEPSNSGFRTVVSPHHSLPERKPPRGKLFHGVSLETLPIARGYG